MINKELKTNRSSFTRKALRDAISQCNIRCLEEQHMKGRQQYPVKKGEFSAWKNEQNWGRMKRGGIRWYEFKFPERKAIFFALDL